MKTLCVCAFALIGLHAFAVYVLPELVYGRHFLSRTWGFDFLTFYPPVVAVCAYLVALAVAVPHINLSAANGIERVVGLVKVNKAVLWVVLCLFFGVLFVVFKQKYAFLGDGYLRPAEVINEYYPKQGKGVMFSLMQLQGWLGQWDKTAVFTVQVFSVFWGLPYVVLACAWSDVIGKGRFEKVFCFLLMVLIGCFQYFFGYVETYAPLPAVMLAFLLFGVLALRRVQLPIWSTVFFVVGVALHVLLLFLTPALLFLWWLSLSRKYPIFRDRRVVILGVTCFFVFACIFGYLKRYDIFLQVFPSEEYPYGILTLWHVWEFFNGQVLSAPVALPVLLLSGVAVRQFGKETAFLFLCVGAVLGSLFVVDAVLGSIDWDIYALSGVPLMALATYTLEQVKNRQVKKYAFLFSSICAGLLILPFISINHTDKSIDRVMRIIKDDPGSYYYNLTPELHLAMSFESAGLDSLASVAFEKANKKNPRDRRNAFNMGIVFLRNDQYTESIPYFLKALQLSPDYEKALDAMLWLALHYPDLVVDGVETHLPESKHNVFWVRLGFHGIKTGKVQLVHDVPQDIAVMIARQTHFHIAKKDTVTAARLLKNTLLGHVKIK